MAIPSLQVPYRDQVTGALGTLSTAWQSFFRGLIRRLESEYVTASSSNYLLSTSGHATGEWAQMTGNSVRLTPGIWLLSGQIIAAWTASAPTWSFIQARWSGVNGDKTTSAPALLTVQGGHPEMGRVIASTGHEYTNMTSVRVQVTETMDVYLDAAATYSGGGDAYLKTHIYAERITTAVYGGAG
jgi:hypothetical protein